MLCIKELGYFGYILLSVSLRPSFLSLCVYVLKILNILKKKKKKKILTNYMLIILYIYYMIYNSIFLSDLLVICYIYNVI